jgi:hypothetical protein
MNQLELERERNDGFDWVAVGRLDGLNGVITPGSHQEIFRLTGQLAGIVPKLDEKFRWIREGKSA